MLRLLQGKLSQRCLWWSLLDCRTLAEHPCAMQPHTPRAHGPEQTSKAPAPVPLASSSPPAHPSPAPPPPSPPLLCALRQSRWPCLSAPAALLQGHNYIDLERTGSGLHGRSESMDMLVEKPGMPLEALDCATIPVGAPSARVHVPQCTVLERPQVCCTHPWKRIAV